MKKAENKIRLVGRREYVDFPELKLFSVEGKIDTGAYTSSLHCKNISLENKSGTSFLVFETEAGKHEFKDFFRKRIKNSFGEMEERYVIKTSIKIGRKTILTTISLSDRENLRYPVLIGRRLLKGKFLIDVSKIHTGGVRMTKAINDYI